MYPWFICIREWCTRLIFEMSHKSQVSKKPRSSDVGARCIDNDGLVFLFSRTAVSRHVILFIPGHHPPKFRFSRTATTAAPSKQQHTSPIQIRRHFRYSLSLPTLSHQRQHYHFVGTACCVARTLAIACGAFSPFLFGWNLGLISTGAARFERTPFISFFWKLLL